MKKMHINSHSCGSDIIDALGTVEEDVDIKLELELQLERERKSASDFPEFYKLADVMESHEGAYYRSGEIDGKRFMTNDDYNRVILERTKIANWPAPICCPSIWRPITPPASPRPCARWRSAR